MILSNRNASEWVRSRIKNHAGEWVHDLAERSSMRATKNRASLKRQFDERMKHSMMNTMVRCITPPSQLLPRFPDRVRTRPASQRSKASARPSRAPPSRRTRSSIATGFLDGPGVCSSCHHSTTRSYYCHTTARILRACARACVWRLACVRVVYSVWRPQLPAPHSCAHTAPNVDLSACASVC